MLLAGRLNDSQAKAVLGALRRVATAGGAASLTAADQRALDAFDRFVLRRTSAPDLAALSEPSSAQLGDALGDANARTHVVQFLVAMALIDGVVDTAKISVVVEYTQELGVNEDSVRQLAELGRGNLAWVRADVQRQNLLSITGHEIDESVDDWILPYRGDRADPALAARYRDLRRLPVGTLGRTFFEFYQDNRFASTRRWCQSSVLRHLPFERCALFAEC